jgi:L-ribulokinase
MRAGIPLPFGAFDAHWDAIGTRCAPGDVVNVVGTSTCIIAIADADARPVPGICGMVPGSVVPGFMGIEAGQSATGDVFDAIARRAGSDVATLCEGLMGYGPCATGLLRVPWDNGDRTVLVRPDLGGVTLGWDLHHRAADEMHAAIEGMAMHVGLIIERMQAGGARFDRIINAGGIPQKNDVLNQVYADVLGRPVHVPERSPVGVGACIFAAMIAGDFETIAEAQERMAPPLRVFTPRASHVAGYERLTALFRDTYFAFGEGRSCDMGAILPALRRFRMGQG